jgi:hypothetical protein
MRNYKNKDKPISQLLMGFKSVKKKSNSVLDECNMKNKQKYH